MRVLIVKELSPEFAEAMVGSTLVGRVAPDLN